MKSISIKLIALAIGSAVMLPASLQAQEEKEERRIKEKENKERKEEIIISRKGDEKEKVVIEIDGEKITVNGKPLEEYKGNNITIRKGRAGDYDLFGHLNSMNSMQGKWNPSSDVFKYFGEDENRAMLGVTTEQAEGGVRIESISKESAASKAGLKESDVITKVDETKIEDPDDLSEAVKKHKPGDKVTVTYLRDKKESKVTAELGKWKSTNAFGSTFPSQNFKMDLGDLDLGDAIRPKINVTPGTPMYRYSTSGTPKLGLSVQDTDDGKGVKIIEVDHDSNAAKAGVKNNDVVLEVDGKAVNGADEMAKVIRESKDKNSVMMKVQRDGKNQNIEVKIPKKLKTANL